MIMILLFVQTVKKNTPKGKKVSPQNSKKLSPPHVQEEAAKKSKNFKSENESKTTPSKSVTLVSKNTSDVDSKKVKKEKVTKTGTKEGGKLISSVQRTPKTSDKNSKVSKTRKKNKDNIGDDPAKKPVKRRPLRKRAKVDYSLSDHEKEIDDDKEWSEPSSESEEEEDTNCSEKFPKKKNKSPLARTKVSSADSCNGTPTENSSVSFINLLDDDSDFEVSSKPLVKRKLAAESSNKKKPVKIISSDDSDESIKCLGVFADETGLYHQ